MSKYDIHIEEDFWNDFIVEAFEHIDEIESNAMSLEQNPEDVDLIHTMFRAFHTIKGLSGFVEHTLIQEVAHKTETLMDYCRKGELAVSTQIVDAILKSSDYIKRLCNDMNAFKEDDLVDSIEKLLVVLENLATVGDTKPEAAETPAVQEVEVVEVVAPVEVEEPAEETVEVETGLDAFASLDFEIKEEPAVETSKPIAEVEEVAAEVEEIEIPPVVDKVAPAVEVPVEKIEEVVTVEEPVKEKVVEPIQEVSKEAAAVKEEVKPEPKVEIAEESKVAAKAEDPELKAFQNGVLQKLKGAGPEPSVQKVEASKDAGGAKPVSVNEEYMKVANSKIDNLVDMMGELIINQSLIEQYVASTYSDDKQLITNMSGFLRITRELQNLSMSLRMVSMKSTFQKINRIARDTIQELGKNVELIISGENTEVDRVVTDKLLDPLVHLIKNAISHGVEETSEDRIKDGKNPRAKVELNAYSKRGKIFIEVIDDGRGINTEVVYQKALEKELIDPNRTYTDAEIKEFILLPGFSTAKVVDNISGRGVGMDVVKTQILKIGGKVDIQSTLHKGSVFTLEVPVNNSIMNGTIIEMNKQHFVVPTINVKEFLQPTNEQWIFTKSQRTMIRVRDNIIPIVPMSVFFKDATEEEYVPLVMIVELDQELRAVPITNVINRQEVVVKPVGEEFSDLKFISGMSILGTGKVSLILDIDYLFRKENKE